MTTREEILDEFENTYPYFPQPQKDVVKNFLLKAIDTLLSDIERELPKEEKFKRKDWFIDFDNDYTNGDVKSAYNSCLRKVKSIIKDKR
ncbi:MAG: hypothetical protein PF488_04805 [Patescibacteria group bacterium]|jgi:hypothetical protein|nr:hypothetical protein [Patescibacteria group bacterium]